VIATVKIPKSPKIPKCFLSPTHIDMWMRQTHKTVHCKRWVELGSPQMDLRIYQRCRKKNSRVLAYYALRACWERPYRRELWKVS
jgi:uncharacterized protein YaeQ